jgi:hypothetical protein
LASGSHQLLVDLFAGREGWYWQLGGAGAGLRLTGSASISDDRMRSLLSCPGLRAALAPTGRPSIEKPAPLSIPGSSGLSATGKSGPFVEPRVLGN